MNKGFWVGVGHLAMGIAVIAILQIMLRLVYNDSLSPAVTLGGLAPMVIFAARKAYDLGKKDGVAEAQNRVTEESDGGA